MKKEPLKTLLGANGQLYIYDDHLEIHRKGTLAKLSHIKGGNTVIGYYELDVIKMKPGLFPISGYMYFGRKSKSENVGFIASARHPDCIVFRAHENSKAREIYKYLKSQKGTGSKQASFKDNQNNKDIFRIVMGIGLMTLLMSLF